MMDKKNMTTISIERDASDYLTDLQYILKQKAIGKIISKMVLIKYIVEYIRANEEDFIEYVKKEYSRKAEVNK